MRVTHEVLSNDGVELVPYRIYLIGNNGINRDSEGTAAFMLWGTVENCTFFYYTVS